MDTNNQPEVRMKDGKPHALKSVAFAKTLVAIPPLTGPAWDLHTTTILDLPRIPIKLFRAIVAWQRKIAKDHICESTTSLFLVNGEWVAECFYQSNTRNSMTADVSYEDPRNAELLAKYADISQDGIHATIHNHVNMGASQSGRDADDEKGLPGPHITIGNLNQKKLSWHSRLSTYMDGKHAFIDLRVSDILKIPLPPGGIKLETLTDTENAWLTFDSLEAEIPEEWNDRFELKTWTQQTGGGAASTSMGGSHGGAGAGTSNPTLEEFITANKDKISKWPYDFLDQIDIDTLEGFKKSLEGLSMMEMHAAHGVLDSIAPQANNYRPLLHHLRERAGKPQLQEA